MKNHIFEESYVTIPNDGIYKLYGGKIEKCGERQEDWGQSLFNHSIYEKILKEVTFDLENGDI